MSPLQVAQLSPHKERCHPPSLSFVTFRAPRKGAPPLQVPLTEFP